MAPRGRERRKGLLSPKERVMAKRKRPTVHRRCRCCRKRMVTKTGNTICAPCYRLLKWGPGRVLRLKARLERLVQQVLRVQAWFARNQPQP